MANLLTGIRIGMAAALIGCPVFSTWFYVLYLVGGISDVLDGMAARHFGKATKFGARLDTAADILFTGVVLGKVLLSVRIPLWLVVWIACIAVIKCCGMVLGLVRYRRFAAEHTTMNKICGVLLFVIPLCIGRLPWQAVMILIVLTCAAATVAAIQEGYDIYRGKEVH